MTDPATEPLVTVADVLTCRYGLTPWRLVQLPIGQGTINYRATCTDRDVFVKNYPPGSDLIGEADAIWLSALSGRHSVPVADLLRSQAGDLIDASSPYPVSVWEWMPGAVVTTALTAGQAHGAGNALGRIHTTFATLPASAATSTQARSWFAVDIAKLAAIIDRLTDIAEARLAAGPPDTFVQLHPRYLLQPATFRDSPRETSRTVADRRIGGGATSSCHNRPKWGHFRLAHSQDALDEFWLHRHHAARILLDHHAATDTLLHELTARR
ncbi:aminoglycoside phosphotransferase/kinase family protein [Parafrankia elaeagni]|uniref:phosphotransferase n=1 Tax=Parafrankia elaeagni TaxID=222534 RepID=UPI0003697A75|nr:phosphotransferase [Parafrankia elaeagni]